MNRHETLAVAIALCFGNAAAQTYPHKPIRMIIPGSPGGPGDILARLVGVKLSESVGQPIVIDTRPGANGNIGYEMVARSAPDGYTITLVAAGFAINPSLYHQVPYDL